MAKLFPKSVVKSFLIFERDFGYNLTWSIFSMINIFYGHVEDLIPLSHWVINSFGISQDFSKRNIWDHFVLGNIFTYLKT